MGENVTGARLPHFPALQLSAISGAPAVQALLTVHPDTGPTDAPIHAIHRGPSGYIPLAVKDDGREWRELGAIQVGQPFLPGLLAQLVADGYFGLNSSYRTGVRIRTSTRETWQRIPGEPTGEELVARTHQRVERINPSTGLPHANHQHTTLRWLNVAYADLDCYKCNRSVGDALGAIVNLQDTGTIPPATMFARSGRGLWAFWFLLDGQNPRDGERMVYGQRHQPWTPARATSRALALYARIQRAIADKLAALGADMGAIDGPRYAPVPGTVKTNGAERVLYWVQGGASGPAAYTLAQLAAALGLELRTREHPIIEAALTVEPPDAPKDERKRQRAIKGWKVRWLNVVRDLELLLRLRGRQFTDVSRNEFALFYAAALDRAGMARPEVNARIHHFGALVGLTDMEIRGALRQAFKRYPYSRLRRATYLATLKVTDAERSYLDANRTPEPAPTHSGRVSIAARREAILDAIAFHYRGKVPSVRDMAAHLASVGIPCGNHTTVHRDYQALGLKPTTRPGRPPKLPI